MCWPTKTLKLLKFEAYDFSSHLTHNSFWDVLFIWIDFFDHEILHPFQDYFTDSLICSIHIWTIQIATTIRFLLQTFYYRNFFQIFLSLEHHNINKTPRTFKALNSRLEIRRSFYVQKIEKIGLNRVPIFVSPSKQVIFTHTS